VRLANSVYLFVHDRGSITSLLAHFDRKNIAFFNSARKLSDVNELPENPLVILRLRVGGGKPPTTTPTRRLDDKGEDAADLLFDQWWSAPVMRDAQRRKFSRHELIAVLRNHSGGGHVSSRTTEKMADLNRKNSMGWESGATAGGPTSPLLGFELASVAQIAHELRRTIERECADLLDAEGGDGR